MPPNMQVGQYREDYDYDPRRYSASQPHHHRPSDGGYYAPPPQLSDIDRPSSRDSRHRGEKKESHHAEKSVGATLLGGAAGGEFSLATIQVCVFELTSTAFAGHELGKGGLSTLIGAVAGGKSNRSELVLMNC